MTTLADDITTQVGATGVRFIGDVLYVALSDSREISISLDRVPWLHWLLEATGEQRAQWSIEPRGFALYWDQLDDGIELCHLLGTQALSDRRQESDSVADVGP